MKNETNENAVSGSNKKKKGINVLLIVLIVIAAGVFCFAGFKLVNILITYNQSADAYKHVREAVHGSGENKYATPAPDAEDFEPVEHVMPDGMKFEYEDEYDEGMVYDYDALHAINPDIIGYIKARGTGNIVDYPIVQCDDNDFYIDHMFDGTQNYAGAIFMDYKARRRFNSFDCIIYGHNMRSGSRMFGYLKQYENEIYFNEHLEYDIYTPYSHYVYKVVAAYVTDIFQLTYTSPALYEFMEITPEERVAEMKKVLEEGISLSKYKTDFDVNEVNEKTRIITLSTCQASDLSDPHRFVVLLVRDRVVIPRP